MSMDNDEDRKSKYPPPHPMFLQEHQEAVNELRTWRGRAKDLEDKLFQATTLLDRLRREMNGGPTDPFSDVDHPGHVLILLGWINSPAEGGLDWEDPEKKDGKPVFRTLPEALGLACRRLLKRASLRPLSIAKLSED